MTPTNPIIAPTQPWAIVCCYLEGSQPDPAFLAEIKDLFVTNSASLTTFWRDQSLGAIDLSKSDVFGWYPCEWTVRSTESPFSAYPGVTKALDRPSCLAQARKALQDNVGDVLWHYRGIIAVFNFSVNGGFSGTDVAYGVNGTTSAVDWAESGWVTCRNCLSLLMPTTAGPCTNPGGATGAGPSVHVVDTSNVLAVPTDKTVLGTVAGFSPCSKCDCMYDASAAQGSVTCAAGGQHTPATSTPYYMMAWKNPVGAAGRQLYVCKDCQIVTGAPPDGATKSICPATGKQHSLSSTELSVVPIERDPFDRTFLAHEMGHAYGFNHGLGWQVQTTDISDDCLPGAYGDWWDIMSAMHCDYYTPVAADPDYLLGPKGPGLALHHLVTSNAIDPAAVATAPISASGGVFTLRPAHRPDLPGYAGIRVGHYLLELRARDSWDRALRSAQRDADGPPISVAIYDMAPVLPTRLLMPSGRSSLVEGEWFESRHGLGGVTVQVETLSAVPPAATLRVTNTGESIINRYQRWLVLRCAYLDGTDLSKLPDPVALLKGPEGVEAFWSEAANGAFFVAGGGPSDGVDAVKPGDKIQWIPLLTLSSADQADSFETRVGRVVSAARDIINWTNTNNTPLYVDYRNFTGLMIVRNVELAAVSVGTLGLSSGNALGDMFDCGTQTKTGLAAGNLSYDVIELGTNHLTHAAMAAAIGQSLKLSPLPNDRYDVMGTDAYRTTLSDHPEYGTAGPIPSTDTLMTLGWLSPDRIARPNYEFEQATTGGSITIGSLEHRASHGLPLRAEIGPYSFELRVNQGLWDGGLEPDLSVIARDIGGEGVTQVIAGPGGNITWGAPPADWAVLGGGSIAITIDRYAETATLNFVSHRGRLIVAGGLLGEGTLWTYVGGKVVRVPLGDPYGGELVGIIQRLEALTMRYLQSRDGGTPTSRTQTEIAGDISIDR